MTRRRIGKVEARFAVVAGVLGVALGIGLLIEAGSPFGRAWAAAFIVFGLLSVLGALVASNAPVPGSFQARATGAATFAFFGGWAAVTAVVGAVEESWLWGVLLGAPAAYLLWLAVKVGRARSSGRR